MIIYVTELVAIAIAIAAIAVIGVRDLFALIVLLSVYSGLLAVIFAMMGAPDVAFTEAVVGTSVSTIFFMALIWWIDPQELTRWSPRRRLLSAVPAVAIGVLLLHGIDALPPFGDPAAPGMVHVSPGYLEGSVPDLATPNVVTGVLGDYRSFDTLIETAVVLAAALGCLLTLQRRDDPTA